MTALVDEPRRDGIDERQAVDALSDIDLWRNAWLNSRTAMLCHVLLVANLLTAIAVLTGHYAESMTWFPPVVGTITIAVSAGAYSMLRRAARLIRIPEYRLPESRQVDQFAAALRLYMAGICMLAAFNIGTAA